MTAWASSFLFALFPTALRAATPQDPPSGATQQGPATTPAPTPTIEERLAALEKQANAPDAFKVIWRDGLRLTTNDEKVELRIGGRLQFEGTWSDAEEDLEQSRRYSGNSGDVSVGNTAGVGPLEDGTQIRRARLYLQGTAYEHVEFKLQFGFEKGTTTLRDVYAGLQDLGDWIPNVRAGHQWEPFGLETITSSFDHSFIERSTPSLAIGPARNPGLRLWKNLKVDGEERLTWAAGVFREDGGDNGVSSGDGGHNVTARLTGTPFWQEKGKRMLHVGASGTRRSVNGRGTEPVTYSTRPEADLLNVFLSTGAMREADVDWRCGVESAFFWNAFSLQGEYLLTKTDMNRASALDDPSFHGWYVAATWMLTGEPRRWNATGATYANPKPATTAFVDGGIGAWEVALRHSSLDLTDGDKATGGVEGGEIAIATLGLNWYLNANTKVMFDLSRVDLDVEDAALGEGGDATVFQTRIQFSL